MPTPTKGTRLGGSPQHHKMILANLATELFRHGRITTTKAKAKKVQPLAERMVTFAKRGDLHARRRVLKVIRDKDVVHKLFADIGPAAAERNGGYTRVIAIGPRKGDGAEMAVIELVDRMTGERGGDVLSEAPTRRWSLRRRKGATLSRSAREREEAIAAAEDAGEDTYEVPESAEEESAADDAIEAGRITERALAAADATATDADEDEGPAPDVTPEAVAARLGETDREDESDNEVVEESDDAAEDESDEDESEPASDEEE